MLERGQWALAAALVALAGAVLFFALELAAVRKVAPEFMTQLKATAEAVEPVAAEIGRATGTVPDILAESEAIRAALPPILDEIAAARAAVDKALAESAAVRAAMPDLLAESTALRETVPGILTEVAEARAALDRAVSEMAEARQTLPDLLASVDATAVALDKAALEIEAVRPLIPEVLDEAVAIRNRIDPTLDRLDAVVANARSAGQEASEGAVSGLLTGILKAPFSLFGGFGGGDDLRSLAGTEMLTQDDFVLAREAFWDLDLDRAGDSALWRNPETGLEGSLTVVGAADDVGEGCRRIRNIVSRSGEPLTDKVLTLCPAEEGRWGIVDRSGQR
ncbi:MAG: hypothetical protein NXI16_05270 [Alphaproteobacteria bacterium]|nr:hypothetical protein [Alphaproteobacteria bacterium]